MMKLFDSNILIYAFDDKSKYYKKSRELIDMPNACITNQNIIETFRVITSFEIYTNTFTPQTAWKEINKLKEQFKVLTTRSSTIDVLETLINKYKVKSYGIYDANLVAHMIDYCVSTIYTNNPKDFLKFKEIEVINPFS